MTHRTLLRTTATQALLAANTHAGTNVRDTRTSSPTDTEGDGLIVYSTAETDTGLSQRCETDRDVELVIYGWVTVPEADRAGATPAAIDAALAARLDELEEQCKAALSQSIDWRKLLLHPGKVTFRTTGIEPPTGRAYQAAFALVVSGSFRWTYDPVVPANIGDFEYLDVTYTDTGIEASIPIPTEA